MNTLDYYVIKIYITNNGAFHFFSRQDSYVGNRAHWLDKGSEVRLF